MIVSKYESYRDEILKIAKENDFKIRTTTNILSKKYNLSNSGLRKFVIKVIKSQSQVSKELNERGISSEDFKHGWIKNSAHLSAAAPWVLLLLLSTQPATSLAFSTPTGVLILLIGLVMTAVAYIWMNRLGRLPELPRVFGGA